MNNQTCVITVDMGGTFIKSACVTNAGTLTEVIQTPSCSHKDQNSILNALSTAITTARKQASPLTVLGVGISTPGPFDYINKTCLMTHKFKSIYGVPLEKALLMHGALRQGESLEFLQDANAYLLGEYAFGAAKGWVNCALVTLGTGLGFAALVNGKLLTNGLNSCYISLYRQPWKNGIIEDVVSAKGLVDAYTLLASHTDAKSAKDVCDRARLGDPSAQKVLHLFGEALGESIAFHLKHIQANCLVIGGQIAKSFDLFETVLTQTLAKNGCPLLIKPAMHLTQAALLGAGSHLFSTSFPPA